MEQYLDYNQRLVAKVAIVVFYILALLLPLAVFFDNRGGASLFGPDIRADMQVIFPIFGLIAFTLVTMQVMLATNLYWLKRLWPSIIQFHRAQGSFALLFALLHPLFILIGFGLANYLSYRFVAPGLRWWLLPAYLGLTIMILTVVTATLAWYGRNLPWWRRLHRLNYLLFALVWLHSWFIGTDIRTSSLRWLWLAYALLVIASVTNKYRRRPTD